MTKNKARKSAARAAKASTGMPYTLALRATSQTTDQVLCGVLADSLRDAFVKSGWVAPSDDEAAPTLDESEEYILFVGPAQISVARERPLVDGELAPWGGGNPDDPSEFDLSVAPEVFVMCPPAPVVTTSARAEFTVRGDQPVAEIVRRIGEGVTSCRAEAIASRRFDAACSDCGTRHPSGHLMWVSPERGYCPFCLFDNDPRYPGDAAQFADAYDGMRFEQPAMPSAWTALAVLIANMARFGTTAVADLWADEEPGSWRPLVFPEWKDLDQFWIWLPQTDAAPACLRRLGAGASLGAVLNALDSQFGDIRGAVMGRFRAEDEEPEERTAQWDAEEVAALEAYWPTIVTFAVTYLMTSTTEGMPPFDIWGASLDSPDLMAIAADLGVPDRGTAAISTAIKAWMLVELIAPEFASLHADRRWL